MGLMRSLGFATEAFPSADALLSAEHIEQIDCLILDMQMPCGATGLELYERLLFSGTRIPAVLITAYPDEPTRARALAIGLPYLTKPVDEEILLTAIRSMLAINTTARN
jgi:FixJ family two-component response regulator